jgi:tripartite-type tricarboxylate transporter receptor subunit TctC
MIHSYRMVQLRVQLLLCVAMGCAAGWAQGQTYPAKPIRLLIGAPPGGGNDVLGRVVAQRLTDRIGQQVVVENRGGAGQTIAGDIAAKSPADGYTLLLVSSSFMISALVYPKLPYDTVRDFAAITQIATIPQMLVVHPSLPVKTGPDLVALAKKNPGALMVGSGGNGSTQHLGAELFKHLTKTHLVHIPFKGAGPAIAAMLSGDLQVFFSTVPSVQPLAQAGKLKAIAAAVAKRIPTLPDLPTLEEQGVRGMDVSGNYGLLAPAATPAGVIRFINEEAGKVLATPEVRDYLAKQGAFVATGTPAQFQALVKDEIEKWRAVVRISGMKPD